MYLSLDNKLLTVAMFYFSVRFDGPINVVLKYVEGKLLRLHEGLSFKGVLLFETDDAGFDMNECMKESFGQNESSHS